MSHVIRPEYNFRRCGVPHFPDDRFVLGQITVDVEDQQIWVERIKIVLSGAPQGWRLKSTDGAVLDLQVRFGKTFLQIRHDMVPPTLRCD